MVLPQSLVLLEKKRRKRRKRKRKRREEKYKIRNQCHSW
jgi:hypothetical protein